MEKKKELPHKELVRKMSKIRMSALRGKNDQKSNVELGRELDLYVVNEIVGQGLPLLTPKGTTIKREIERFVTDEELKRNYLYTSTPIMAKSDLYKVSGHWQHYKDSMFSLKVGKEIFALRPMTCPFHFILYKRKPRNYKDLPLKYAEMAFLFRNEQSGELRGLTRVRQFTLADAHIICKPDQLEEEFEGVMDLINFVMNKLGIKDIWYKFSKWDPKDKKKYIDNPEAWNESQKSMKSILDKLKLKYSEEKGGAAFYGPKLDLQYKDVYGKEDTLITVQIDFALPERFDLTYVDERGQKQRPMVLHRSSSGCTERTMAYILEKTQGKLPLWLSPVQVKILTINESIKKYAKNIFEKLKHNNIRIEIDNSNETIGKKIRNAQLEKVNYMIILGNKEKEKKLISIRERSGGNDNNIKLDEFIQKIKKEIANRTTNV